MGNVRQHVRITKFDERRNPVRSVTAPCRALMVDYDGMRSRNLVLFWKVAIFTNDDSYAAATTSTSIRMSGCAKRGTSTMVEAGGVCAPNNSARTFLTIGGCFMMSVT